MPDRLSGGERYRERIVASFRRYQLVEILEWYGKMNPRGENEIETVLAGISDEKKRARYAIGLDVISDIGSTGRHVDDVHEVLVWQTNGQRQSRFVEYRFIKSPNLS